MAHKEKHKDDYEHAVRGYLIECKEKGEALCVKAAENLRKIGNSNLGDENFVLATNHHHVIGLLSKPEYHGKEIQQAIDMFRSHTEETYTLTRDQWLRYWDGQFMFSNSWAESNRGYVAKSKSILGG